jgi:hypothetical protein
MLLSRRLTSDRSLEKNQSVVPVAESCALTSRRPFFAVSPDAGGGGGASASAADEEASRLLRFREDSWGWGRE